MTLLQKLLIETLSDQTDPILIKYIELILPKLEQEFGAIAALGGAYQHHYQAVLAQSNSVQTAHEKAERWSKRADQSLLVHVLNGLITAWNISQHLEVGLSELEKQLLCLGITLHDYNKYAINHREEVPKAFQVADILKICEDLGNKLNFEEFWSEWKTYLTEIAYLAQNTQFKTGTNIVDSNWGQFQITDSRRLDNPLRRLLAFGDIAVHITDPAEIVTDTTGKRLKEHLRALNISQDLAYHRVRDTIGILTNAIHNATLKLSKDLGWEPLLYLASGVIYLTPIASPIPESTELNQLIVDTISSLLRLEITQGNIGFKRDGKGLKAAPLVSELLTDLELINVLHDVIVSLVKNIKDPATPKRLEAIKSLSQEEKNFLKTGADIRADRLAEFILFLQVKLFNDKKKLEAYSNFILGKLDLANKFTLDQTQEQSGGVNYGWYRVAAYYIATNPTLNEDELKDKLISLASDIELWSIQSKFFKKQPSITETILSEYLKISLEVKGWNPEISDFERELSSYVEAKQIKTPICSLSSGEFESEEQMETVVLFKPQQYSNKNSLGGTLIKRGISKIWGIEMLLRQAIWSVGKELEEQNPIFIYIFPAYVYSPQIAAAIRILVKNFKRINIWEVVKIWRESNFDDHSLSNLTWEDEPEKGRFRYQYPGEDIPFMATIFTTTKNGNFTESWIEPIFIALSLSWLLGVKIVATPSHIPIYNNDQEFLESVVLDGVPNFWSLLGWGNALRVQELQPALKRLLILYTLHLENIANPPDSRWSDFSKTVREVMTNVLNLFVIVEQGLRKQKINNPSSQTLTRYWNFINYWIQGDELMTKTIAFTTELVAKYRKFYQVDYAKSSHEILLPLTKAFEQILGSPDDLDPDDLIEQGAGQIHDALERQDVYKRPLLKDKSVDYGVRKQQELIAIKDFMTFFVREVFLDQYKGDRALLQENRNRIKSGAEFSYRWLTVQNQEGETK